METEVEWKKFFRKELWVTLLLSACIMPVISYNEKETLWTKNLFSYSRIYIAILTNILYLSTAAVGAIHPICLSSIVEPSIFFKIQIFFHLFLFRYIFLKDAWWCIYGRDALWKGLTLDRSILVLSIVAALSLIHKGSVLFIDYPSSPRWGLFRFSDRKIERGWFSKLWKERKAKGLCLSDANLLPDRLYGTRLIRNHNR